MLIVVKALVSHCKSNVNFSEIRIRFHGLNGYGIAVIIIVGIYI